MDDAALILDQCLLHALHVRNLSKNYVASVRLSCRMYFEHSRARRISDCTRDSIEAWLLDGRANRAWSAATYRGRHRDVGFLFRYLLKKGKISEDPTVGIELPKLAQALPKALSADDAERLLATVRRMKFSFRFEAKRNVAVIAMMVFT